MFIQNERCTCTAVLREENYIIRQSIRIILLIELNNNNTSITVIGCLFYF